MPYYFRQLTSPTSMLFIASRVKGGRTRSTLMGQLFVGGEAPAMTCCKEGDLAGFQTLLVNDKALHIRDVNGWTYLQVASAHGHVDIVQYLVESKGVPIPIDSPDNPLQLARANGNDEVTKYLSLQINKLSLGELLENMNDPVILVKNATTIVGFNKSAEALLGFQKQQMIGLPASTIFPKSVQSFVKCEHTNLFHSSGNTLEVEVSVAQMTDDRDLVTLRAGTPLAIHQIIKSMNDAVVLSDRYGTILAINGETLFGYKEKELVGKAVDVLIWDEDVKKSHTAFISNYHRTGRTQFIGIRRAVYAMSKHKEKLQVEILLSEMEDKKLLGCFRSIRDTAQMEYELQTGQAASSTDSPFSSGSEQIQYFMRPSVVHFLIPTCAAGDVEGLKSLRDQITDVNELDYEGLTALHHAAKECCKILIEEFGALPDLVDANGNTPASYALEEGHEALYEYLLSLDVPNDHYVTEVSNGSRERSAPSQTHAGRMAVRSSELVYGEQLGSGSFGVVFKGKWRYVPVAIKNVRVTRNDYLEDLLQEALLMLELRPHPNVVSLLGVCTEPAHYAIITEYLVGGSLDKALENLQELTTLEEMLQILLDVSLGMAHLHREGMIHRDLAARNVLLTNERPRRAKISDFGFAKIINKHGNNEHRGGAVRWMAPESLVQHKFSIQSDVWSYGVLCYEVLARAPPHKGMSLPRLMQDIGLRGLTPTMPENSPVWLVDLTGKCWAVQPNLRPTFPDIITIFTENDVNSI